MKKMQKKIFLSSLVTLPVFATAPLVVSCKNKNQVEEDKSLEFSAIKQKYEKLNWDDFLLAKKVKDENISYKDYTYESFFEWGSEKGLNALDKIEINGESSDLTSKESQALDNNITAKKYISKDFIDLVDNYNKTKNDDEKLIVILRSQKLPLPEAAILVWTWLTKKKYLKEAKKIEELKNISSNKIVLYGHWFYNREYDKNNDSNKKWKIVGYVVPTISFSALFLYIIIAILVKRKKIAFKAKKGRAK
ncbi:hypothetical protein ACWXVQ_00330 [Mycoplasma sp. 527]